MSVDARVEIVLPDGATLEHRIARESVLGTAEAADVRVPPQRGMAQEHLKIDPVDDGARITLLAGAPLVVDGRPWSGGMLPYGTELRIGETSVRIERTADEKRGLSPVVVLGLPAIAVAMLIVLSDGSDAVGARAPAEAPALFDEVAECSTGGGPTRHRADVDAHGAAAKAERYPFAPADGVQAAGLYRRAARCYEAAGDASRARELDQRADRLEGRLEQDYRTSRFRLERALEQQRWQDALAETHQLRALLSHRSGPYVQWLSDLERRLETFRDREEP